MSNLFLVIPNDLKFSPSNSKKKLKQTLSCITIFASRKFFNGENSIAQFSSEFSTLPYTELYNEKVLSVPQKLIVFAITISLYLFFLRTLPPEFNSL